jgi:7-carboxy-7-deazaguanine synthase (Cx14CxxC type)
MSSYTVKEIFYTLQGEGRRAGRPAVFCRFSGCNLWSGREADRDSAQCRFCDTDFVGTDAIDGGRFADASELAGAIAGKWIAADDRERRYAVLTGGEPLLQVDEALVEALHEQGFEVAVETNGTLAAPRGLDWICVSPKAGTALEITSGNELKVVVPQPGLDLDALVKLPFEHHLVQPMDGPDLAGNTAAAIELCLKDPRWNLSIQAHKLLGLR